MELQIQDLLTSIRSEGIEKANAEAADILAKAKQEADAILASANAEADAMRERAKKDTELYANNARLGAEQAKRDAVLAFKAEMLAEFERLLSAETGRVLNDETLVKLISAALNGENPDNYAAEVGEVSESLKRQLSDLLKAGLEIRPVRSIRAGFRLSAKDGSYFFDYTDDEIAQLLMPFFRSIEL